MNNEISESALEKMRALRPAIQNLPETLDSVLSAGIGKHPDGSRVAQYRVRSLFIIDVHPDTRTSGIPREVRDWVHDHNLFIRDVTYSEMKFTSDFTGEPEVRPVFTVWLDYDTSNVEIHLDR